MFNSILHRIIPFLLWPNWKIPSKIFMRKLVYVCSLSLWDQHYIWYHNSKSSISHNPGCMAKEIQHSTLHRITNPTPHLDNDCSQDLKAAFSKHNINYQLVPPAKHWVNAAEHAIHTFKDHFIAILSMVDLNLLLAEWDRLLPHAVITLNLLWSHLHPSLSAHASLFGNYFDYNWVPFAPPGHQEQKW